MSVLLKNIAIADNSVVGACLLVTQQFKDTNAAIAVIVKRNINRDRKSPATFNIF